MIALVDYGAGNLTSVRKAFTAIGASVWTPSVPGELARAHGIVIPGVGHFDSTRALTKEWRHAIKWEVENRLPVLGICVGLQWLFSGSDEAPDVEGLDLFKGTCFKLSSSSPKSPGPLKVPHVGWNSLEVTASSGLMQGIESGTQVYFTHSYAAPVTENTVATCEYGGRFSAAVQYGHLAAVQFHPEKSGEAGLRILSNWLGWAKP
ncbi:MAG TPA: imidazole glycerol phosphate synthase subunit HisH [Vicinamibacterales bacterium]|nr:imidazole glycerol phosphate synthase subunit HisH [Vicinamibacterales bacterium]